MGGFETKTGENPYGDWRAQIIYNTNLSTSYAAGRYAQSKAVSKARPYWQYWHSDASHEPRHIHKFEWHGKILHHQDPWWTTHYPPNGWGCKCVVRTLTAAQVAKKLDTTVEGIEKKLLAAPTVKKYKWVNPATGEISNIPEGIDPGWNYAPGAKIYPDLTRAKQLSTSAIPQHTSPRPPITHRTVITDADLATSEKQAINDFFAEFGILTAADQENGKIYIDKLGEANVISLRLMQKRNNQRTPKTDKHDRWQYYPLLAKAIKDPDEIWVLTIPAGVTAAGKPKYTLKKNFIKFWFEEDSNLYGFTVFQKNHDGKSFISNTTFQGKPGDEKYANSLRVGKRAYTKDRGVIK